MDKMIVSGGASLRGEVQVSGAKNSALKMLFASLLAEGEHVFHNVPNLADVESASRLLEALGSQVTFSNHTLRVTTPIKKTSEKRAAKADYDLVRKMRASILCLGPLLAKHGEAIVSLPGGCAIGSRPIDLHLEAMRALGAEVELREGYVHAKAKRLCGTSFLFEKVTVGGTENMMMAATLAEGETVLENVAKEPEISDLAEYLIKMGAKISGHGTSVIRIQGVEILKPAEHTVIADRIEAGTLLIAGAISMGEVTVKGCSPHLLEAFIGKMREAGFRVDVENQAMTVHPQRSWRAVDITTAPHPLFPTDLQAQFMALMTLAQGTSVITETVFENRFMHVTELMRLGADITPKTQVAVVRGRPGCLTGAPVMATDLRASASLVLAGLAAQGDTTVNRIYHLDRGYEKLEEKLSLLGAKISRKA
jgi:UDP-N-acetylglucosamine 1-carboxyvinyltransferase